MALLTLDRIFNDPDLTGSPPESLKFSPDARYISFLKPAEDNFERLDIWAFESATGKATKLIDSGSIDLADRPLSDEEKAIRERKRIRYEGIVEYYWSPDSSSILFPANGCLFLYALAEKSLQQISESDVFATDISFSPNGDYLSYVANQNIYCIHIKNRVQLQLTTDGGGPISNGIAEFIAQEEMHRFEAYWWAPDSSKIAYTQTDESPIEVSQRYEIDADSFGVFDQRYPYAGTPNARVKVGVITINDGNAGAVNKGIAEALDEKTAEALDEKTAEAPDKRTAEALDEKTAEALDEKTAEALVKVTAEAPQTDWINLDSDEENYVCRVNWLSDSNRVAVQVQSRNQQQLELKIWECHSDSTRQTASTIHTENSNTWINLHNCFRSLEDPDQYIWASEESGFNHLYLKTIDGNDTCQLTRGNWVVQSLLGCDETRSLIYFSGFRDTALESHLYSVDMQGNQEPRLLSKLGFNHQFQSGKDTRYFIDRFSNPDQPPGVNLIDADGETVVKIHQNGLEASHPFTPYLPGKAIVEYGELNANDGQSLHYRLLKPQLSTKGKKHPVILVVYGGPGVQRIQNEWIPPWYHYMTQRGYGILQLDNRGTANRGVQFESPIHQQLGVVEVQDQLVGVEYLKTQSWVDSERLGVFGHSYGGYMTLMLMLKSPDTFKAGISVAPVTDWRLYDTHYTERYLGLPQNNATGYQASNVFPYIHDLKGQLLLIHGMADDNVLFTNSTKLYKALQDENLPFEIMNYPGAKHGLTGRKVNLHRYSLMDRFFDKYLESSI